MINFNGKVYQDYNSIPSAIIKYFYLNLVFEYQLRWENGQSVFVENHYFKIMSQLRRLRLNIPMFYTLDFFIDQINKTLVNYNSNSYIVTLKFANDSEVKFNSYNPKLILSISANEIDALKLKKFKTINQISFFNDYNFTDQEFGTISFLQKDLKRIASIDAFENGFVDSIILNKQKLVIGSVLGNIFLFKGNKIITPSINIGVESIVISDMFIDFIKKNDYEFAYENFGIFELQTADEISILSTKNGINPVLKFIKKTYANENILKIFNSFIDEVI